ncbi:hypothetical protein, partial [Streptomyces smyrnaeus]|uniref:hypothetical protein n=1 Tax=Streptomyces smyrnaeus TaxID=1387713 RepID=UPI0036AF184F
SADRVTPKHARFLGNCRAGHMGRHFESWNREFPQKGVVNSQKEERFAARVLLERAAGASYGRCVPGKQEIEIPVN